jgi:Bacterial dnaA protein helix-turn-helix
VQSISALVHDDPYLKMLPEERIALRRRRREKFRPCELANPVIRFTPILPVIADPVDVAPKHERDLLAEWVKRQKEIPICRADAIEVKPFNKVVTGDIQRAVAAEFGLSWKIMFTASRHGRVVLPRQIAIYLTRELIGVSLQEIGRRFGGRDHTTILHAVNKIQKMMDADACFAGGIDRLRAAIVGKRA